MLLFILFLHFCVGQEKNCELCDLIEYQNSDDNDPMFHNRTKFNWTSEELRERINQTLINQLKIDIDTLKQNKEIVKTLPLNELRKAVTLWNKMKVGEQTEIIRQIRIPTYVPVPVYTIYQVPILHHFPVEQLSRSFKAVPLSIPIENRIDEYSYNTTQVVQDKVVNPMSFPYDVKVPIPVIMPVNLNQTRQKPTFIKQLTDNFQKMDQKKFNNPKPTNLIEDLKKQFLNLIK